MGISPPRQQSHSRPLGNSERGAYLRVAILDPRVTLYGNMKEPVKEMAKALGMGVLEEA